MFRQTAANMRKDIGHRGSPHLFRKMKNSMVRKLKTSDFFEGNIRTFDAKHPYFQSKKSDVLQLPDRRLSPPKIFFQKSPTLPTPGMENPNKLWHFRV